MHLHLHPLLLIMLLLLLLLAWCSGTPGGDADGRQADGDGHQRTLRPRELWEGMAAGLGGR